MRESALACLLLAVAAFGLPWQRCASDCHDRVLPAVGAHDCHEDPCEQHGEAADHERIEFLSVPAPAAPALLVVPLDPSGLRVLLASAPPPCVVPVPYALPPDGEPPTATTVLLI